MTLREYHAGWMFTHWEIHYPNEKMVRLLLAIRGLRQYDNLGQFLFSRIMLYKNFITQALTEWEVAIPFCSKPISLR